MKGVFGILLVLVGLEVAYLVLAGKLPLQLKTSGGAGGGPDGEVTPLDIRQYITLNVPSNTPARGYPVVHWKGLLN